MLKYVSAAMAAMAAGLAVVFVASVLKVSTPVAVGVAGGVGTLVSVVAHSRQARRLSTWAGAVLSGLLVGGISGALVSWLR